MRIWAYQQSDLTVETDSSPPFSCTRERHSQRPIDEELPFFFLPSLKCKQMRIWAYQQSDLTVETDSSPPFSCTRERHSQRPIDEELPFFFLPSLKCAHDVIGVSLNYSPRSDLSTGKL
ncbi:UNVERIFIED_CONTAM: hypothetical protein FKN15_029164 [Acipenser sinensis]